MPSELVEVNERVHERIDDAWMTFLERLFEGDCHLAARDLRRFMDLLDRHMSAEETHALPAFRELAGAASAAVAAQVEGDHVILRRAVAAAARLLEEVAGAGRGHRRLLAGRLGVLARVSDVLAHHSRRERERFYPALDAALDTGSRARLHAQLAAATGGD